MSVSNGKLGEDFLRIPKLAADGENWMMYKERLQWSIDARGLLGHLDGMEQKPTDPQTLPNRGPSWTPSTPAEVTEVAEYKTASKEWQTGEAIAKQQIAGTIPDTLSGLFEQRSHVVSIELLRKLQDQKCASDESFTAMIMSSLPSSYDPHLSALTASAKVSSMKLTADTLMSTIVDEYDRRVSKSKKTRSSNDDAAYNANAGQCTRKIKGNCHNCGKYGHMQKDCRGPGGGGASGKGRSDWKGKDKKSETAASTKDKANDEEPHSHTRC